MPPGINSAPTKLTRPPYERMSHIHEELQNRRFPNCSSLAKRFEISGKTVQRDIDFMRDRWSLPIEYDNIRRGFYYSEPVENLPLATVTEGELVALLVAQKAIEQFKGTSFEAPLINAFAKLTSQLGPSDCRTVRLSHRRTGYWPYQLGIVRATRKPML